MRADKVLSPQSQRRHDYDKRSFVSPSQKATNKKKARNNLRRFTVEFCDTCLLPWFHSRWASRSTQDSKCFALSWFSVYWPVNHKRKENSRSHLLRKCLEKTFLRITSNLAGSRQQVQLHIRIRQTIEVHWLQTLREKIWCSQRTQLTWFMKFMERLGTIQ